MTIVRIFIVQSSQSEFLQASLPAVPASAYTEEQRAVFAQPANRLAQPQMDNQVIRNRVQEELMISIYNFMLFLHVSGDIGLFIGIGIQLLTLIALRQARHTHQVRSLTSLIGMSQSLSIAGALLTIATGLYMALTSWGLLTGWIAISLGSLFAFVPLLVRGIIEPRMRVILSMAADAQDGPIPAALAMRIFDPALKAGVQTLAAVVLGIVFLMTTKPPLVGSIAVMLLALALGLASGLLFRRDERQKPVEP